MRLGFTCSAAGTLIYRHQFALLAVKLLVVADGPFMEPTATQGFTLMFLFETFFLELYNLCHCLLVLLYEWT